MPTFYSRYPFLKVNIDCEQAHIDPRTGNRTVIQAPTYAKFVNGTFTTVNANTIEAMVNHRSHGSDFHGPIDMGKDGKVTSKSAVQVDPVKVLARAARSGTRPVIAEGSRTSLDTPLSGPNPQTSVVSSEAIAATAIRKAKEEAAKVSPDKE